MKETHERILKAAVDLFSTSGYAATTTKDIASKANISEVTLFRHFDSKRNLFKEALHRYLDMDMLMNFCKNEISYNLHEDLSKLASYLFIFYKENSPLIKMMVKDGRDFSRKEMCKMTPEMPLKKYLKDYFIKMHKNGEITDDPIMCMRFYMSNIMGYLMRKFVMLNDKNNNDYYNWMVEKTIAAISKQH